MSYFIDVGPDCWARRTVVSEARSKSLFGGTQDVDMKEQHKKAIIKFFQSPRKIPYRLNLQESFKDWVINLIA